MPFGLQPIHLIVVAVVALLIFGPRKLPEIGRSIGKTLTEFRKGAKDMTGAFMEEVAQPDEVAHPAAVVAAPAMSQPPASVAVAPASSAAVAQGNFCIHCGKSNPDGAVFCNSCGSKIAG